MLATLVIGLREGLEAALIVGIIAAFLRRTGASLRPMWLGVAAAIALSLGVGVTLEIISAELPQAQQEALETIIGVIAVVFVTSMIAWMNRHAKGLKRDLERSAATAVRGGTTWALVAMAFLAVLKEGFETSVFLLAAFQSSTSSLVAGAGALLGIGISVGIGIGIYRGGIRLNLSKFFRITGVFLVFVAAGLVLSAVRTAHEAGWIQIGQQATIDLGWLAPTGSIQAALLTGILGIPADPRLIEVLAWALYLVPVLAYLLWPVALRPAPERLPRLWVTLAAGLAAVGIVLAIAVPLPGAPATGPATLVSSTGARLGSATLQQTAGTVVVTSRVGGETMVWRYATSAMRTADHEGLAARVWNSTSETVPTGRPTSLTLDELVALAGGRLPVGINATQDPGPFDAAWATRTESTVWMTGTTLLDASRRTVTTLTLRGGGLASPRTISVTAADPVSWTTDAAYAPGVAAALTAARQARAELLLWKLCLPVLFGAASAALLVAAARARRRQRGEQRDEARDRTSAAADAERRLTAGV